MSFFFPLFQGLGLDSILLHGFQYVGGRHIKYSVSADGAIMAWKIDSSKAEELIIFYLFIYLKNCILCNVTWVTALEFVTMFNGHDIKKHSKFNKFKGHFS